MSRSCFLFFHQPDIYSRNAGVFLPDLCQRDLLIVLVSDPVQGFADDFHDVIAVWFLHGFPGHGRLDLVAFTFRDRIPYRVAS